MQGDLLRKEFPGYRELSLETADLFGDHMGVRRRFEWRPKDGVPVTQIQIYLALPGRGYTATATTPSTQFEEYELTLLDIIEGLLIESIDAAQPVHLSEPPAQPADSAQNASDQA